MNKNKIDFRPLDLMVLTTTLLGNKPNQPWLDASNNIITFIGNAFGVDQENNNTLIDVITKQLQETSTITDVNYQYANPDSEISESAMYFNDIKFRNILMLQNKHNENVYEWNNYLYYHHYDPSSHYQRIKRVAKRGDLIACRHTAILEALGIGTIQNFDNAILRLKQAVFWGDISSAYLLRQVYRTLRDEDSIKLMNELIELLERKLDIGITIVDDENKYSEKVKTLYVLISSTFHDIVKHSKESIIDYSFVEVMLIDKVSYHKKLDYINNYSLNKWKDESNSTNSPQAKFGFVKGK